MPLSGVRDISPLLGHAPTMPGLKTEPFAIHRAEILHLIFESESSSMLELLPKALHPTIPPTVTFNVMHCPEGPAGPFTLAQVRVGCRAGVRPRGFPLACFCDSDEAAAALKDRWGYNCLPGAVRLRHLHDRVVGTVEAGGHTALHVELVDPHPISGNDVQYTANMNLARVPYGVELKPRLVQVDPEYTFHRAERGRPSVVAFDQTPWHAAGLNAVYGISATYAVADVLLPRIRYLCDPDITALQGTETVN